LKIIIRIYSDYDKRPGTYKITHILERDYGIKISVGRAYRRMRTLQLSRISTDKPLHHYRHKDTDNCLNHLQQEFDQKAPNILWVSYFTYLKVNGKYYYPCILIDLLPWKVIAWSISGNPDIDLIKVTFQKVYTNRNYPIWFFTPIAVPSIMLSLSGSFWIPLVLYSPSPKRSILLTMPVVNVSSNILRRKKVTEEHITLLRNYRFMYFNMSKVSKTLRDLIFLWVFWLLTKGKTILGESFVIPLLIYFIQFRVHLPDYCPILGCLSTLFFGNYPIKFSIPRLSY